MKRIDNLKYKHMKQLLILFSIFALISCSEEEVQAPSCNCDARYKEEGFPHWIVIENVPIDCETRQPLNNPIEVQNNPNLYFVGCTSIQEN